ncbi:MAG: MarC family protein, partial [Candidatus Hydrothermarchaeales archaeon]
AFKPSERAGMIKRAVTIALIVLIGFVLLGRYIFDFLGVEMYSFQIAGGILLFIIALEMLFGRKSRTENTPEEEREAMGKEDITVTPMAIPLLTGPGAITLGIVLFNNAGNTLEKVVLMGDIVLVFLVSYAILVEANKVFEILGQTGTKVIVRIMGLLLAAIAVQFVISGVIDAMKTSLI